MEIYNLKKKWIVYKNVSIKFFKIIQNPIAADRLENEIKQENKK